MSDIRACEGEYVRGPRRGQSCPNPATAIIDFLDPFHVCGYHARAYAPSIVYPLVWSLARIRQWQMDNLDRLLKP